MDVDDCNGMWRKPPTTSMSVIINYSPRDTVWACITVRENNLASSETTEANVSEADFLSSRLLITTIRHFSRPSCLILCNTWALNTAASDDNSVSKTSCFRLFAFKLIVFVNGCLFQMETVEKWHLIEAETIAVWVPSSPTTTENAVHWTKQEHL